MGKEKRETLLSCAKDSALFSNYIRSLKVEYSAQFGEFKGSNGKKLISFASEILQELNHKQYDSLWNNLTELAITAMQNILESFSEQQEKTEIIENDTLLLLQGVCMLLLSSVRLEEPTITPSLIKTVNMLHGSLFDLCDINAPLAACICLICEEWWKKSLPSHEKLCLNTITYLLRMFLHKNKNEKLVNICQMQKCLAIFDLKKTTLPEGGEEQQFESNEEDYAQSVVEELRQLLLSCFLHFVTLKESNGRKFLSSVMLLDKDIMKDAHEAILDSIGHSCPITKAEALGSVYFLAWRSAELETKKLFEETCIQQLMYRAAHAPCTKTNNLFLPMRRMLLSIVCHKGSMEVRHMITRLYSPIIWRSLKANNAMVRANSAGLLLDAFPLEDNDSQKTRVAGNEDFMQYQFDALNDMLLDAYPRIRVIGILGLCDLLHMYWDAIPAHIIAILTRRLYNELAFDSIADVRHAVFKGTILLLDTPCAHPLLGKLLPLCVEKCIHDMSEKVRIAVADVLLAVKQTSSITFWKVCPLPNLLAQLEMDNKPVSKRLIRLLLRSYLPEDQSKQVWVERCATFYQQNVNAARKFYMMIDEEDLTLQETAEFLNLIGIFTYNCVAQSLQQGNNSVHETDSSPTESSENENDSHAKNRPIEGDVLAGLLDTSCILWKSLERMMPSTKLAGKNREMMMKIMITFSRTIHVCLKMANEERFVNAILLLSTYLPPSSLPVFSKSVLPKLRSLGDEVPFLHYGMLIECVCAWDWSKQLLELINDWLSGSLEDLNEEPIESKKSAKEDESNQPPDTSRRSARLSKSSADPKTPGNGGKKKKKTVMFTGIRHEHRPAQGIKYLSCFLNIQSRSSFPALDQPSCLKLLLDILSSLEKSQVVMLRRFKSKSSSLKLWSNDLLVDALQVRCNLTSIIHLHEKEKQKNQAVAVQGSDEEMQEEPELVLNMPVEKLKSIIDWFSDFLKKQEEKSNTDSSTQPATSVLSNLSLYRRIASTVLQSCFEFLACGIHLFDEVEDILLQFTESGSNMIEYIGIIAKLIHQLHEHKLLQKKIEGSPAEHNPQVHGVEDGPNTNPSNTSEFDIKDNEKMICIFDCFLSSLLQHARQNPDSFLQVFRHEVRQPLRSVVKEQFVVYSLYPKQVWYEVLTSKTVSAILADLFNDIRASSNFSCRDRILDLPVFSASLLSTICATAAECQHVCQKTIPTLASDETTFSTDNQDNVVQTFAHLLYTLSKDGKHKEAANSCIEDLNEVLNGFKSALNKVESNESGTKKELSTKSSLREEEVVQQQEEQEEIVVLEDLNNPPMFMDDEFVV